MSAGQCLKLKPVSEFVPEGFFAEDDILVTDSIEIFSVYGWFIGSYHSRKDGLRIEVLPDILGAFVDTNPETDTMAGAVPIVAPASP